MAVTARVLDGKALAARIIEDVGVQVAARVSAGKPRPSLATVLIGDNPASGIYIRSKQKNAKQAGIDTFDHRLPDSTTTDELLTLVEQLNRNDEVSGVLIQQPAPPHIDMTRVIHELDPVKDVDGFHPINSCSRMRVSRSRAATRWLWAAATSSASPRR